MGSLRAPSPLVEPLVASSSRYLQTAGQPFFMHGYTAWSAIVALDRTIANWFLDQMKSRGVTALMANAIDCRWTPDPPKNAFGAAPFTGTVSGFPDFSTPNEAYWAHVDWFLARCSERGIAVLLFPAYYGYIGATPSPEGWGDLGALAANGSTRLTTYGAFLGARYATATNVIWAHYGDALPDSSGRALVKAISDGIRGADRSSRLHTNHFARPSLSSDDLTVPIDLNAAYAAGGGVTPYCHTQVLAGRAVAPTRPTFLIESRYEGNSMTAQQLRAMAWDTWLSGGCGHFIGNRDVWVFGTEPTKPADWWEYLNSPGLIAYGHVRAFFIARSWWLLQPASGLLTSGGGTLDTDTYATRALASDGSWAAILEPDTNSRTVDMTLFSGSNVQVRRFDPVAGTYGSVIGTYPNTGTRTFTHPGNNAGGDPDWILLLEVV